MLTVIWGNTFIKAYKRAIKKHPDLKSDIETVLRLLAIDPFSPQLETHKLKGKLSGSWACSAGSLFLIEIGSHDEVY